MRRTAVAVALLALVALPFCACGKYGPPVRSHPAAPSAAAPSSTLANPSTSTPSDDEKQEKAP